MAKIVKNSEGKLFSLGREIEHIHWAWQFG